MYKILIKFELLLTLFFKKYSAIFRPIKPVAPRINILFYGFSILRTIKKRYKIDINEYNLGFSSDLQNHLDLYVNQMEELYSHDLSKDKIDKIFSNLSGDDVSFIRKNLTLFQSGDATNSNINDQEKSGYLSKIIIWSLIIGLVGWLLDTSV